MRIHRLQVLTSNGFDLSAGNWCTGYFYHVENSQTLDFGADLISFPVLQYAPLTKVTINANLPLLHTTHFAETKSGQHKITLPLAGGLA